MKTQNKCILNIALFLLLSFSFSSLQAQWSLTGNTVGATDFIGSTNPGHFRIRTNNIERVYISSTGFVGIGTTTPVGSGKLVVSSTDIGWSGMYVNAASSGAKTFYGYSTLNSISAYHYFDPGTTTWNLVVGSTDRLTVNNSGNVGIGTMSPTERLHVIGNGKFSANLVVGGNIDSYTLYSDYGDISDLAAVTFNASTGYFTNLTTSTLVTSGNCTFGGSSSTLSVNTATTFTDDVTFTGSWFSAKKIVSGTNNSAAGVEGNAILNHPSLVSFGVYGSSNGSPSAFGVTCSGNGYYTGNWSSLSDARFKKDVNGLPGALDMIKQLKPSRYEYQREAYGYMNFPQGEQYGFIAQELEKVLPVLVSETSLPVDMRNVDGEHIQFKMINYIGLIPVLTKAIQEQQEQLDEQAQVIGEQNERIAQLEKRMDQISTNSNTGRSENTLRNQLYSNQPNPFDKETIIRYTLSQDAADAYILLINMEGKTQQMLPLFQKGEGWVTVQANQLEAGVYSYVLMVNGMAVDTKKMVVTK